MNFYESRRNYKLLAVVSIALFLFSAGVLVNSYAQKGEFFARSIELRGGTIITIKTDAAVNANEISGMLSKEFGDVSVSAFSGFGGSGFQVTAGSGTSPAAMLERLRSSGIDIKDYSTATMGPALSESFWLQAQVAVLFAFIMMGAVVFAVFRSPAPSLMVIISAACDIFSTMAFMQVFGIELSLSGLAALLMLIGYSVDTDILLTNRLLKNTGEIAGKTIDAMKTGLTMSFTTIGALAALLVSGLSPVLSQIASILLIGMFMDIIYTWIQNYFLLRWYMEKRGLA